MDSALVFGVVAVGGVEIAFPSQVLQEVADWPERFEPQIEAPDYVLGTFNLRGRPVPTLDLRVLFAQGERRHAGGLIAIVQTVRGMLGLAVDEVADLVRMYPEGLCRLATQAAPEAMALVSTLLVEQGGRRVMHVVDVEALAIRPGVKVLSADRVEQRLAHNSRLLQQFLFFDCDGLRFCVEAAYVCAVIDRPVIEKPESFRDVFLGLVQVRGRAVPVHDLSQLLALPRRDVPKTRLLVLDVRGQMAAILVSDVVAMQRLPAEQVMPMPWFGLRRPDMFSGVVAGRDGGTAQEDALLLSHEAILGCADVTATNRLHQGAAAIRERSQPRRLAGPRKGFLSFQAGDTYTVPLDQIEEIMAVPARYLPLGSPDGTVFGVLKRRGGMVALVSFRRLAGHPDRPLDAAARALLVCGARGMFAFVVDGTQAVNYVFIGKRLAAQEMPTLDMSGPVRSSTNLYLCDTAEGERAMFVLDLVALADLIGKEAKAA